MKDLISIIIPVYNSEKYLKKCLDSILRQTYTNIEIILVDDGSTDNSRIVCLDYMKMDKRIKYIKKKNGGVSSARNVGLKELTGKYVLFIDSDDYIDETMVKKLYDSLTLYDSDMSMCNIYKVDEQGKVFFKTFNSDKELITGKECMYNIFNYENAYCYPINKLFNVSFLQKNNIKFDEKLHFMEDFYFVCEVIEKTKKITNNSECLYFYVHRKGSATHSKFNEKWLSRYDIQKEIIDRYSKDFSIKTRDLFFYDFVMNSMSCYCYCKNHKILSTDYKKNIKIYYDIAKKSKYVPKDKKIKIRIKYRFPMLYFRLLNIKNK